METVLKSVKMMQDCLKVATWDGSITDDCISCGICCEVCPEEAITLHRGTISVDLDKCILCENCSVHCPVDAIPRTTMHKKKSLTDSVSLNSSYVCTAVYVMIFVHMMQLIKMTANLK